MCRARGASARAVARRRAQARSRRTWLYGNYMADDIRAATNQAPPLVDYNVVTADVALVEAITRHASTDTVEEVAEIGAAAGSAEAREHGLLANRHEPRLTAYDRY